MYKVLIIEDNYMHLEMVRELLTNEGFLVLNASNAKIGIEIAKNQIPDLILMDMDLPEIDGYEATRILKNDELTKNITIVAMTALVMKDDIKKAFDSGCAGFISKPIEVSTFIDTVKEYINDTSCSETVEQIYSKISAKNISLSDVSNKKHSNSQQKEKIHNILITDDNPMNAELLKEAVEQMGKCAYVVHSGKEALEMLQEKDFDLVLLDIMMPEMSGFEVIETIKKNSENSNIPVIFISALNETKDIVRGLDLGSYGYITKPYNIDELKARISSVLRIKDLQDELRKEKEKFDQINKFSADGIVILNTEFNITSCSDNFTQWVGRPKEEIIDQNFCTLIRDKSSKNNNYYTEQILKDKIKYENNTMMEVVLDNFSEPRFLEINISKINNAKNEVDGYVCVLRDVTVQKEIEKQKETFIATLTHDLKTPIRAEIRSLELLLKGNFGKLEKEQEEIISEILYSSRFMFNMIDTLLAGYKYDNGKVEIKKDYIDINEIIQSCSLELRHLINEKEQEVTLDFQEDKTKIYADPIEIKRLITNLLSNAISYTQEKGKIKIKTEFQNNEVKVSVIDNGRGISPEHIPYLFDKYTSYSKRFRQVGTGLGLYVAKHIVETHGGTIQVESEEGKGSTFTFTIPSVPVLA